MLFTALAYSWYQDKNRKTPPELFNANQSKNGDGEAVPNESNLMTYSIFLVTFIVEVALLFYAVPIALRMGRDRLETFTHLMFAIFFTPFYVFAILTTQIWTAAQQGQL